MKPPLLSRDVTCIKCRHYRNCYPGLGKHTTTSRVENRSTSLCISALRYLGGIPRVESNHYGSTAVSALDQETIAQGQQRTRLDAYVGVRNLFDEEHYANVRLNGIFGRFYEPAPGRSVYGGLALRL